MEVDGGEPALTRDGGRRTALAVGLAAILGSCAFTWPLLTQLGESLAGNLGDPLLNATILGWNVQWLTGQRGGTLWDAPIFHPHDNALAYSEHLIGQTLFVWPLFAHGCHSGDHDDELAAGDVECRQVEKRDGR